ncbi:MAG: DNA-processing protein DprA [Acidimicrobiales bacterium]|jgi:DNA processing protein
MTEGSATDPAFAAALLGLAGMTPVRLARLLDGFGPKMAWNAVRAGTHPGDPARRFVGAARATDPSEVGRRYAEAGIEVLLPDRPGYPAALVGDLGAPAVLCASGDPSVLEARPAVAVVGTRSATPYGAKVASALGKDLAAAGVVVVSGLARGIDAATHSGALAAGDGAAPPVAVVGTGLDRPYPKENSILWRRVASAGVVLSEAALGTEPRPRVFPARNRIIAALSDVVVVVESHRDGGSLYTAEAAARRSIPVCAVPGSVYSRSSSGTNGLLVDGCTPVRDADDVLAAVALARQGRGMATPFVPVSDRRSPGRGAQGRGTAVPADRVERSVWEAVDDTPTSVETVLLRTGLSLSALTAAGEELVERGLLTAGAGWWSRA